MAIDLNINAIGIGGIPCPHCLHCLPPFPEIAPSFFAEGPQPCGNCGNSVDLWEAGLRLTAQPASGFLTLISLGARRTGFLFDLAAGERKEMDLTNYGIPPDATVLQLSFTPQGSDCFAQVLHPNLAIPRSVGIKFVVYGLPQQGGTPGAKTACGVTWIRESQSTESWLYFADAFEALSARKFRHVILPAHVAFEITLVPTVESWIALYALGSAAKEALNEILTASVSLNLVLPLLCEIAHAPRLQNEIVAKLNQLRKLRNKLVHEGFAKDSVTEQIAVEMLIASMFGFEYLRFLRTFVIPQRAVI